MHISEKETVIPAVISNLFCWITVIDLTQVVDLASKCVALTAGAIAIYPKIKKTLKRKTAQ